MWARAKEKGYQQQPPPPWQQDDYDGKSNQPKRPGPSGMQKGYPPPPPLGSYSEGISPTEKLKGYPYSESHQPESGYPGYVYRPSPPQVEGAYLGWKLPYDENSNLPAYVVSAEFEAERSWRQLLQRRGLPYTPYKVKTYDDRINNTMDYHESYVDGLFQKISSSSASSSFVHPPPPPLKEKRPLRVLSESEDEDDALYEVMYGRKKRQLDEESLKLRKDKKFKSLNRSIIYADEVSKKKQLNLIENERKMRYLEFKRAAKGSFV